MSVNYYFIQSNLFLFAGLCLLCACEKKDLGPSPVQSPEEELASFTISSGLQIQLVASEPMIQDPVVIAFDEDGRLWVVEMRGFMADIDGSGEHERSGSIVVLEDTNEDGLMDKRTVYIDSLIMPRALALVSGGALIVENEALWLTQDFDGDLHADSKVLLDSTFAGSSLPEHSGNGLLRNIDNKYYNVKSQLRYQFENDTWIRDSTEFRGQWGLSHDDEGRLFYNYNWSQLHADLVPPNYLNRNKNHQPTTGIDHGLTTDRRIYPIRSNLAVNRGYIPGTLDKDGRLLEFTAACSPFYYRGNALPNEYYGNVFVCEPSGNLIKRNVVVEDGYYLSAYDPIPGKEFLASTDERFRPVYLTSGPDGALYVSDMYKGLIQYGAYMTPYLRDQTLSRKLDQPVHGGRIWRIVPKDWKPTKGNKLSTVSSADLIGYLSDLNGWTRDIAQRLLVEKNDSGLIDPLKENALNGKHGLGRFHALWTLEGLKINDVDFIFQLLGDSDVSVRTSALRILEPFAERDKIVRARFGEHMLTKFKTASDKEVLQMALSARVLDKSASQNLLVGIIERYDSSALIRDAVLSSLQNEEFDFLQLLLKAPSWKSNTLSHEIFLEMLTTSIINKHDPQEITTLLSQLGKAKDFSWQQKAILTGMTIQRNVKPIQLRSTPEILKRTNLNIDSTLKYAIRSMFEWPGHTVISTKFIKSILNEAELKQFTLGRQHYLTTCAGCHGTDGAGLKRFAPPLAGSEWVLGNEKRLALIILHGMEGAIDVKGIRYDQPEILPVMPAHTTLDDAVIAAILVYIRNEWGNSGSATKRRTIGLTRNRAQGRVQPWTMQELEKYMLTIEGQD